ncbi:hypothetical protein ACHWQZ_G004241 [Mnemiopsis leidyi]
MQARARQAVKAFDLLPVLDYKSPSGSPTCVTVAGNDVYVGYSTGHVRHFLVSSSTSANGRTKYQVRYLDEMIGSKKSISKILVAPTIARIIGLAENQVFVGDMFSMVGAQSYGRSTPKSVTFISVNEASTSYDLEIAVCQARKKSVLLMMVTSERFITKLEIGNLQAVPQKVLWHGSVLLLAYEGYYSVYNLMSRTELELFPYNTTTTSPLMKTLGEGEIYMNGDGLGMIVNESGDVCRAPIAWINQPKFVCYSKPYIVGISQTSIQVYSLLDQQLKQKSGFNDASSASDFNGNIFIVTEEQIYMLLPIPAEEQVERLIDSGNLDQAMALAEETLGSMTRSKSSRLKALRQRAANMYWTRGELEEAFSLFTQTQTPPTDICSLYDTLFEHTSSEVSVAGLLEDKRREYHVFLLQYLSRSGVRTEELNTIEFKLVALTDPDRMTDFVKEKRSMDMKSVVSFLKAHGFLYMLGEYYASCGFVSEAVEQWRQLEEMEVESRDPRYPGLGCIVDLLLDTNIQAVIMSNVEWLISRDPDKTLQLLISTAAELNNDHVLSLLAERPLHIIAFLEELVINRGTDANRYHTQLAQQYLSLLLSPQTPRNRALNIRKKLQTHLLTSDKYAVSLILNKIQGTVLKKELAILYGKLQEHEKALKVLVYEVHDVRSAEEYCREWPSGRKELHLLLLKIYLNCSDPALRDTLLERAVEFLNSRSSVFNYSEVYKIIPQDWPISLIEPFVYRSLGCQAHHYRTSRIVKGLSELEWARMRADRVGFTKRLVKITSGTYCAFCFHPFSDSNCSVATSGEVYHTQCISQIT